MQFYSSIFYIQLFLFFLHDTVAYSKLPLRGSKRSQKETLTPNPIIGIFAQPSKDTHPACDSSCDYIAASYVKWIEGAGGMYLIVRLLYMNFDLHAQNKCVDIDRSILMYLLTLAIHQ